jgi:hypothetical protein
VTDLKRVQRSLNYYLQCYYNLIKPDVVFGFVRTIRREKNPAAIVQNASKCISEQKVLVESGFGKFLSIHFSKKNTHSFQRVRIFNSIQKLQPPWHCSRPIKARYPWALPRHPFFPISFAWKMDQELID